MKILMTTVMKTKMVAALLSWFNCPCFSTSFRFSRAVEKWRVRGKSQDRVYSLNLPSQNPLEFRDSLAAQRSLWQKPREVVSLY